MTEAAQWTSDPYLPEIAPQSLDGGSTSHGDLWHSVSPRWGHSMHTMCSYHGMFPARLAHYFIQACSNQGDRVLDPFSGRGTTILQSRIEGRQAFGNDLNPLAYVLSRAKANPPSWNRLNQYLDELETAYAQSAPSEKDVSSDIRMLFHPGTLRQLLFLRNCLLRKTRGRWTPCDYFLAGAIAGILHGSYRIDGTSAYLSISMPNTFSMSPNYVKNYIRDNNLKPLEHRVFDRLRDKAARLYLDDTTGEKGLVYSRNATDLLQSRAKELTSGSIDLLLTSPPYLKVVNYGTSNWIRLWWLGLEEVGRQRGSGRARLDAALDHGHNYHAYKQFMGGVFHGTRRVLRRDGLALFVIGDVAEPDHDPVLLATKVWDDVGASTGLKLLDVIEDRLQSQNKVSRIWGDTRGQATQVDRILVLGRADGRPRDFNWEVNWDEPYKDAGPDSAHQRLERV